MDKKRCRHCWHYAHGVCLDPEEDRPPRCSRRMGCENYDEKPWVVYVLEMFEKMLIPWF